VKASSSASASRRRRSTTFALGLRMPQREQGFDVARMAAVHPRPAGRGRRRPGEPQLRLQHQAINQAAQSMPPTAGRADAAGRAHAPHSDGTGFDPSPRFFYRQKSGAMNMGVPAENLALRYKISRKEQDEFALRSHKVSG